MIEFVYFLNLDNIWKKRMSSLEMQKQAWNNQSHFNDNQLYLIDCKKHFDDPQCMHDTMQHSPMVGAGHHVREKTQNPIIGVLTQPVPREGRWQDEFKKV